MSRIVYGTKPEVIKNSKKINRDRKVLLSLYRQKLDLEGAIVNIDPEDEDSILSSKVEQLKIVEAKISNLEQQLENQE